MLCPQNVSRRHFLTQSSLLGSGFLLSGCYSSQESSSSPAAAAPSRTVEGQSPSQEAPSTIQAKPSESSSSTPTPTSRSLIVYFSHSGNTRMIAEQIQKLTDGEIWEVKSVKPYPQDYDTVVEQAKKEIDAHYQPPIQPLAEKLDAYETIFVGSPCWWATVAPPIATFLTGRDFSGKTIAPFMTHEGSYMGRSVADIGKYCPDAKILTSLPIWGGSVRTAQADVEKWLASIK